MIRYGVVDGFPVKEESYTDSNGFVYAVSTPFDSLVGVKVLTEKQYNALVKKIVDANKQKFDSYLAENVLSNQKLWDEKYASLSKDGLSDVSIELLIGVRP